MSPGVARAQLPHCCYCHSVFEMRHPSIQADPPTGYLAAKSSCLRLCCWPTDSMRVSQMCLPTEVRTVALVSLLDSEAPSSALPRSFARPVSIIAFSSRCFQSKRCRSGSVSISMEGTKPGSAPIAAKTSWFSRARYRTKRFPINCSIRRTFDYCAVPVAS